MNYTRCATSYLLVNVRLPECEGPASTTAGSKAAWPAQLPTFPSDPGLLTWRRWKLASLPLPAAEHGPCTRPGRAHLLLPIPGLGRTLPPAGPRAQRLRPRGSRPPFVQFPTRTAGLLRSPETTRRGGGAPWRELEPLPVPPTAPSSRGPRGVRMRTMPAPRPAAVAMVTGAPAAPPPAPLPLRPGRAPPQGEGLGGQLGLGVDPGLRGEEVRPGCGGLGLRGERGRSQMSGGQVKGARVRGDPWWRVRGSAGGFGDHPEVLRGPWWGVRCEGVSLGWGPEVRTSWSDVGGGDLAERRRRSLVGGVGGSVGVRAWPEGR